MHARRQPCTSSRSYSFPCPTFGAPATQYINTAPIPIALLFLLSLKNDTDTSNTFGLPYILVSFLSAHLTTFSRHPIPPTTMVYSSESAKWKAYQFLDPFAANSFLVCNKTYKRFCRPDCDAYPVSELKLEIEFVDECQQAMDLGYLPCEHCDPTSTPHIDVKLLIQTVNDVNALIGFSLPALEEKDEKDLRQPVGTVSKNNLEHYRLVDLACRHLALAAAVSIMNPLPSSANSPALDDGSSDSGKKKRKRRGGVLGFKELAAKSKLSAWHFHRVFKSVTGMTPKTYGDMCWEYLHDERPSGLNSALSLSLNLLLRDKLTASSVSSVELPVSRKRARSDIKEQTPEVTPLPKRQLTNQYQTPHMPPTMVNPAFSLDETDFGNPTDFSASRAFSDTDLTMAAQMPHKGYMSGGAAGGVERPYSLFSHLKPNYYPEDSLAMPQLAAMPEHSEGSLGYHFDDSMAPPGTVAPELQEMPFGDMPDFTSGPASSYSTDVFGGAGTDYTGGLDEDFLKVEPDASDLNDALNLGLLTEMLNVGL